jgi:hypothetical protein
VGFSYAGCTYDSAGVRRNTVKVEEEYNPRGDLNLWRWAANTYIGKGCVEMEVLIAQAYAAPLIQFTSVDGVTLFGRSSGSGYGKSASLETGQSTWGSRRGVLRNATDNAALDRVAALNNLPVMYDEMVTGHQNPAVSAKKLGDLILNISAGSERRRLGRNSQALPNRDSRTMMAAVANKSLTQSASTGDTNALAVRVLEIVMSDAIRRVVVPDVEKVKRTLEENYGRAGEVYAAFLGANHALVQSMVQSAIAHFHQKLAAKEADRFWIAAAATLWVGAKLSKHLKLVDFDMLSMEAFLVEAVKKQRISVTDMTLDGDDPDTHLERISEFLNKHNSNLIITKRLPPSSGRPAASSKEQPLNSEQTSIAREYVARIATDDKKMLVSQPMLKRWYTTSVQANYHEMERVLRNAGVATKSTGQRSLGGGTNIKVPPVPVYVLEFDLTLPENARFLLF